MGRNLLSVHPNQRRERFSSIPPEMGSIVSFVHRGHEIVGELLGFTAGWHNGF
jgi:hypothetical protein